MLHFPGFGRKSGARLRPPICQEISLFSWASSPKTSIGIGTSEALVNESVTFSAE
jgi:hypothetical protein